MLQGLGGRREGLIPREWALLEGLTAFLTGFVSSEFTRMGFAEFLLGKIGAGSGVLGGVAGVVPSQRRGGGGAGRPLGQWRNGAGLDGNDGRPAAVRGGLSRVPVGGAGHRGP